ncbi:hypothetical protein FZC79_10855 [Rossellomorea vietnamensis]|uniref:YwpF-like protein n=1 Tax=Rossellomorea vietnamensis TaxID=218284 RepID=A0A5D4KET8_9BACI|nr:YwpF family protein [Rossellomorea vietnamensis]TYR75255.1 hypothetical protein FZC79_10855 [Rossellomorea vietnamensis]
MKTFKVITLQVVENDDLKDIEIVDGLIINKEDQKGTWLIEGCMRKEFYDFFRDAQQSAEDIEVQVVISHPENDPAAFMTRISCIKTMDLHLSVLFEGKLKKMRNEYAELLLDDLVEKGFEGSGLVQEFKDKMRSKPRLAATSKTTN